MTDEGMQGEPMDAVEAIAAMTNMASLLWTFHRQLRSEGFTEGDALKLTAAYVHGMAGGKAQ